MINRNLTIESGLTFLGEVESLFSADVKASDETPQLLKRVHTLVRTRLESGEIKTHHSVFGKSLIFPRKFDTEQMNLIGLMINRYDLAWRTLFFSPIEKSRAFWGRINSNDSNHTVSLDYIEIVHEPILNAIEHGTAYCTLSSVTIRGALSQKGALICIGQTTNGPTKEQLSQLHSATHESDLLYKVGDDQRGAGFMNFSTYKGIDINFQRSEDGGSMCLLHLKVPIALEDFDS